jgi:signal peptidase II
MSRAFTLFMVFFLAVFVIDQLIKGVFLNGFRWYGEYFSLILTYNKGIAFAMFAFLEDDLKFIQLACLAVVFTYLFIRRITFKRHALSIGIITGAAFSNIFDRFIHGGVVDYFFWHFGFNLPVFNFADIMIDVGILALIYTSFKSQSQVPGSLE